MAQVLKARRRNRAKCRCGCKALTRMRILAGDRSMPYVIKHYRRPLVREYAVDDVTGCWNWLLSIDCSGYGTKGRARAHRYMYDKLIGPIPDGMHLDHLCHNRSCVNPKHLKPVLPSENNSRQKAAWVWARKGRELGAENGTSSSAWKWARVSPQ